MMKKWYVALLCALFMLPMALTPFSSFSDKADADKDMFTRVTRWTNESLPLRAPLLRLRAQALSFFGESGSEQVIQGKNGFLFFADTLADFQQTDPLSQEEISALCDRLTAFSGALSAQNCRLILLIAPNKNAVYPENMPARYLKGQGASDLALVQEALRKRGVEVLDALTLLQTSKADGALYFAKDTHWNARGARIVYQALMETLGVSYDACEDAALLYGAAGDLARLCDPSADTREADAAPDLARTYRLARPMRTLNDMKIETACDKNALKLLVLRDSFGERLFPYLANNVGQMVYSRVYAGALTQANGMQVVVLEIAQRNLKTLLTTRLLGD